MAATTTFYGRDPVFGSMASSCSVMMSQCIESEEDDVSGCSWTAMPTPPVSPKGATISNNNNNTDSSSEEDLDLGLSDLLGLDYFPGLSGVDPEWLFGEVQNEVEASAALPVACSPPEASSPLRHDCMWAGHCPAVEQHRGSSHQLPPLSSSPNEASSILLSTSCRTRLDTLGSIRPETPLSLSDSEMEALTSQAESSCNSSSSADESESDEIGQQQKYLPAHILPVRNTGRKLMMPCKTMMSNKSLLTSSPADHSYSHSDHCYHTQRRPLAMDHPHGALTPSDSEEEIDVVSLGEVLRMTPKPTPPTPSVVQPSTPSSSANSSAVVNAPIRLKLKVSTPSLAQVIPSRKTLPSHPSALVRQQLQLAVAASTTKSVKSEGSSRKSSSDPSRQKRPRSAATDSSDGGSSGRSPRKSRGSRAGSDSEDSCEKRSQHNSMERQRRVDLRNAFEFLRSLIPDLEATDRAAKVVILKKASNFCQSLTAKEKQHLADKDALQKRQEMLRKRIALLQRRR